MRRTALEQIYMQNHHHHHHRSQALFISPKYQETQTFHLPSPSGLRNRGISAVAAYAFQSQTTRSPCGFPSNMVFGQHCHHSTVLPPAPQRSRHLFTRYLGVRVVSNRQSYPIVFRNSSLARIIPGYAESALTARGTLWMQRFGVAAFVVVAFVATAQAQSVYTTPALTTSAPLSAATTYTPTNVWAPNPTCSAGSSAVAQNGGYGGGVYRDDFGSYWEVLCNYDWTGTTWYDNPNGPK